MKNRSFFQPLSVLMLLFLFTLPAAAQEWRALDSLAREALKNQDYEKAAELEEKAVDKYQQKVGTRDTIYADLISSLGQYYMHLGKYQSALDLFLEGKKIWEDQLGEKVELSYTFSLYLEYLGKIYDKLSNYDQAIQAIKRCVEIIKNIKGSDHILVGYHYYSLSMFHYRNHNEFSAQEYLEKARLIYVEHKGYNSYENAALLGNRSNLLIAMGRYHEAIDLLEESIEITENILEKRSLEKEILKVTQENLLTVKSRLAKAYSHLGLYAEAIGLLQSIVEENEKIKVASEEKVKGWQWELVTIYESMGKLPDALKIAWQVIGDLKINPEKNYTLHCVRMLHLSNIYYKLGDLDMASLLVEKVEEIISRTAGNYDSLYSTLLRNKAVYLSDSRQYSKARGVIEELINFNKSLGYDTTTIHGGTLAVLANLYYYQKQYEKAKSTMEEALELIGKTAGKGYPSYTTAMNSLGAIYYFLGDNEGSLKMHRQTFDHVEKTYGKHHSDYGIYGYNLASTLRDLGKYQEAYVLYPSLLENYHHRIYTNFDLLSNEGKAELLNNLNTGFEGIYSFAFEHGSEFPGSRGLSYDATLLQKTLLLRSRIDEKRMLENSTDTTLNVIYEDWRRTKKTLAQMYTTPRHKRVYNVDSLEQRAKELENTLTLRLPSYRSLQNLSSWQDIEAALQQNEAAIEFVHFRNSPEKHGNDRTFYFALLLRSEFDQPALIPLFEAPQLQAAFKNSPASSLNQVAQLYQSRGATPANKNQPPDLYELIWEPLDSLLTGVEKVYYSPSGLLHRISFPAIPADSSTFLSDRYQLEYLSSTRNLLPQNRIKSTAAQTAAFFGDIEYRTDSAALVNADNTPVLRDTIVSSLIATRIAPAVGGTRSGQDSCRWNSLPGTRLELDRLARLFAKHNLTTRTFRHYAASEEALKRIGEAGPSLDILHIATHGYFAPDQKLDAKERDLVAGQSVFRFSDNPLLRSGLILAGADSAWCTGHAPQGLEDGILTALEIAGMNLSDTELVILSACETGLGDIRGSEGVYGLQRAFKMAGADYLLVSLWQIPDSEETIEFMEHFYRRWLFDGLSIRRAFAETQREMREKYEDPYYWAGFVLVD